MIASSLDDIKLDFKVEHLCSSSHNYLGILGASGSVLEHFLHLSHAQGQCLCVEGLGYKVKLDYTPSPPSQLQSLQSHRHWNAK